MTIRAGTIRVGLGYDLHRLVEGRPCILGGIELPHPAGPLGHSDGDAVLHAITDAVLGAAGLDDLGTLFSDKDERWKGADSGKLLGEAWSQVRAAGWSLGNVDVVIITEGPRIGPHRAAMRDSIAELLGVTSDCVNMRGKSVEGLGSLAGGAAVEVHAVCLLERT
ncbi:MAG: 2-C-methyl-D-erythritol 2,4-cyclodiphosphate synthase [Planctomycetota bacterium]|jgi:2-C-methyl-D-erythritol 2,4-cyclodiphosphate synthase